MTKCDKISCNHDMVFLNPEMPLEFTLICPHCGHSTKSTNEAMERVQRAKRRKWLLSFLWWKKRKTHASD